MQLDSLISISEGKDRIDVLNKLLDAYRDSSDDIRQDIIKKIISESNKLVNKSCCTILIKVIKLN